MFPEFPEQFVQAAVALCTVALVVFIVDYTWLTRWANWRDPIGLTLTLEAILLIPDEIVALFRWFGPLTPSWLAWEIDVQSCTVLLIGLVLCWRITVFNVKDAELRDRHHSDPRLARQAKRGRGHVDSALYSILSGTGTAGVFCVLFILGWVFPKSVVDDLKAERDAEKQRADNERDRADSAVAAAQATRDFFAALQAGMTLAQQQHPVISHPPVVPNPERGPT